MFEVNASLLILLVEGLALSLIVIALIFVVVTKRRRRKRGAIAQLVSQIKKQSALRTQETGSFLQEIYQLEDEELSKAVRAIDKSEKDFFQKLIDSYLTDDPALITSIDAAVAGMIDTYKDLKPKQPEVDTSIGDELDESRKKIRMLEAANEKLKEELGITKETMAGMIAEFGNMFGGGSDHELANFEVVEKVEEKATTKTDEPD